MPFRSSNGYELEMFLLSTAACANDAGAASWVDIFRWQSAQQQRLAS